MQFLKSSKRISLSILMMGLAVLLYFSSTSSAVDSPHFKKEVQFLELPDTSVEEAVDDQEAVSVEVAVKAKDNLTLLLARHGINGRTAYLLGRTKYGKVLNNLHQGELFTLNIKDKQLLKMDYRPSPLKTYHYEFDKDQFRSAVETLETEVFTEVKSFVIEHSLFLSAKKVGMTDQLIIEMAGIFAWDIDFALDIRKGDRFTVLYETLHHQGEKVANGKILAAEFVNRGKPYQAVLYDNGKGQQRYYDPDGNSMQKAFLRTPLDIFRISSHFNPRRKHPVLNKVRAHKGTDYAAPRGTIVKASGDGKVVFAGRNGGYGRMIKIRHGQKYETRYAHLNGIHSKVRVGRYVKQGQVIGYVGKTGLATGYHLHYEFLVNGRERNPITVKFPQSAPISKKEKQRFLSQSKPLVALLNSTTAYFAGNTSLANGMAQN